jgi:hypothetical protein
VNDPVGWTNRSFSRYNQIGSEPLMISPFYLYNIRVSKANLRQEKTIGALEGRKRDKGDRSGWVTE